MKLSTCTLFAECIIRRCACLHNVQLATTEYWCNDCSGTVAGRCVLYRWAAPRRAGCCTVPLRSPPHYKDNALALYNSPAMIHTLKVTNRLLRLSHPCRVCTVPNDHWIVSKTEFTNIEYLLSRLFGCKKISLLTVIAV